MDSMADPSSLGVPIVSSSLPLGVGQAADFTEKALLKSILLTTLHEIEVKDEYMIFAKPVDRNEAPDYDTIIKHPMDYSTIRANIESDLYNSIASFERDLKLVYGNAMIYNLPDQFYYKQAKRMDQLTFEKLIPRAVNAFEKEKRKHKAESSPLASTPTSTATPTSTTTTTVPTTTTTTTTTTITPTPSASGSHLTPTSSLHSHNSTAIPNLHFSPHTHQESGDSVDFENEMDTTTTTISTPTLKKKGRRPKDTGSSSLASSSSSSSSSLAAASTTATTAATSTKATPTKATPTTATPTAAAAATTTLGNELNLIALQEKAAGYQRKKARVELSQENQAQLLETINSKHGSILGQVEKDTKLQVYVPHSNLVNQTTLKNFTSSKSTVEVVPLNEPQQFAARPVNFLSYGPNSSFAPIFDSSNSTLTVEESKLLAPKNQESFKSSLEATTNQLTQSSLKSLSSLPGNMTASEKINAILKSNADLLKSLQMQQITRLAVEKSTVVPPSEAYIAETIVNNLKTIISAAATPSQLVSKDTIHQFLNLTAKSNTTPTHPQVKSSKDHPFIPGIPMSSKRLHSTISSDNETEAKDSALKCSGCGINESPTWNTSPVSGETQCQTCFNYWKKHKTPRLVSFFTSDAEITESQPVEIQAAPSFVKKLMSLPSTEFPLFAKSGNFTRSSPLVNASVTGSSVASPMNL